MRRNVFTIAPGAPFLETFVAALLGGEIVGTISRDSPPLALARPTIYVPTQRAGRALAVEFARAFGRGATLLPRILPLGGLDEHESATLFNEGAADFDDAIAAPIEELERRLLLAQLVMRWSRAIKHAIIAVDPTGARVHDESEPFLVAATPAGAYALAKDLGALIDDFIIEGVSPDAIDGLADDGFDEYWGITRQFLKIALREWPAILAERGRVDASTRQKLLLEAQTATLTANANRSPVIALGSTGAQPATARLLAAVASLENGAVVLPGLDCDMDDDAYASVGASDDEPAFTHPQTLLKRLLGVMRIAREDVRELGCANPALRARRALISEAMTPAVRTSSWRAFRARRTGTFPEALAGVIAIVAPDERMEALALAICMREALETPGRTAALVTPSRSLGRRVAVELQRFDIVIDDSGGESLALAPAGVLARLVSSISSESLNAVNLAALLAHPLACFGRSRESVEELAPMIEIGMLREPLAGANGFVASIAAARRRAQSKHAHPAARRIGTSQWDEIEALLGDVELALAPLALARGENTLGAFAGAHRDAFEATTHGAPRQSAEALEAIYELFDRLTSADAPDGFDSSSYAALFDRIVDETILRGPRRAHPRLKILGPLEARLIDADLMLLAGLDEGVWPPQADTGAFLNRSMRNALGLPPPERRIGQSAHDFVMGLGASDVVLSRAEKRDGSPTKPSRFLTRLEALSGEAFDACRKRGARRLAIATALDRPRQSVTISRPAPRPPVELRPTKLSVTRIERLRRDPYAIFAEYVLGLTPIGRLGAKIGAREMGVAIHEALAQFVIEHPRGALPDDAREKLLAIARRQLADFLRDPAFASFGWPRVEAGLDHVLVFERERRMINSEIFVETRGEWTTPLADGSQFVLTAVADRIERDASGQGFVFDYKTGAPPTKEQVRVGWSPQLTLEAAMLEAGAFRGVGVCKAEGAAYVGLKNGGKTTWLGWNDAPFADMVADHRAQLANLLSQFRDPATPYPSRPYVAFVSGVGDYDHLARVKEWTRGGGDDA